MTPVRRPETVEATRPAEKQVLYRPSGSDWDHLSETEQTLCATVMQRALKQQLEDRLAEAAAAYREVLARAPNTHDALHMLGAIELRRGNLAEAKQLILAAMKLRAPYPNIEHNLRMVEDLERVSRVEAGRPPVATEELCERALPILVDLALRPAQDVGVARSRNERNAAPEQAVHLIAGVIESSDNSAWLLPRLATLLAPMCPTVWTDARQPRVIVSGTSIRSLAPDVDEFPRGGCQVFVGLDIECGEWIDRTDAERIVIFCQPAAPSQYLDQLRAISRDGARAVRLVFPSNAMAARFGTDHFVLPPPVEADTRQADSMRELTRAASSRYSAGLIGRLWQGTSPSEDAAFLRHLAASSSLMEIYDPGPLRYVVGAEAAVRFWRRSADALRRFVSAVDCVLHVAGKWWLEGDGRELFMAMAAGTPVICPRASIFSEYIDHGVDGLVYDGRAEAIELLAALRQKPKWSMAMGRAARAKVATLVTSARMVQTLNGLLVGGPFPSDFSGAGETRQVAIAK